MPSLLFQLLRERFTGEVAIEAPSGAAHLFFREGCPVYVQLPETAELLGRILLELRLLDETGYRRSLATPPAPGQRYGDVLKAEGLCDDAKLLQGLRVQVGRKLQRLFPLTRGGYILLPGEHRHGMQGGASVAVNPLWVILFGLRAVPRPRVLQLLEPQAHRLLRVRAADARLQHYGLSNDERAIVDALRREERTAAEVLGGPVDRAAIALPLLYALIVTDALELGAERQSPWPPTDLLNEPEPRPRITSTALPAVRPTPTGQSTVQVAGQPGPARTSTGSPPARPPTGSQPALRVGPPTGPQPTVRAPTGPQPAIPRLAGPPTGPQNTVSASRPGLPRVSDSQRALTQSSPGLRRESEAPATRTPSGQPAVSAAVTQSGEGDGLRLPPARTPGERLMAKALAQRAGLGGTAKLGARTPGVAARVTPQDRALLLLELEQRSKFIAREDHFAVLEVPEDVDNAGIEKAFTLISGRLDSDLLNELGLKDFQTHAGRIMSRATEARAILSDAERRRKYVEALTKDRTEGKADKAPELRKARADLCFARAQVFLRGRDTEEAQFELEQAARLNPESGEISGHLAWTRFGLGRINAEEATKVLLAAAKQAPQAVFFYYLGVLYKQQNNDERAAKCFERAVQMNASLTEAASELRLLQARAGRKDRPKPRSSETAKPKDDSEDKKVGGGGLRELFSQPLGEILRRPIGGARKPSSSSH